MRWIKRIIIPVAIVAAAGIGGFVLYNVAYAVGDSAGYDHGYVAGQNVGYSAGEQDGYDNGYASGQAVGYDLGYDEGKADGYAEGVAAGAGHGYNLRNPTYMEAVAFLAMDKTDENEYVSDSYVCSHFARDVCNNAEAEGLRCAFVELRYQQAGHSIIAFETIDMGLVYFEPQFDDEVEVVIGKSYSQLNGYVKPPGGDTIIDILIIW